MEDTILEKPRGTLGIPALSLCRSSGQRLRHPSLRALLTLPCRGEVQAGDLGMRGEGCCRRRGRYLRS